MKQEQWDKFVNMPNEYPQSSELADKAIMKIEQEKRKRNRFQRYWKQLAACAATFIIGFAVGIPVYMAVNPLGGQTPTDSSTSGKPEPKPPVYMGSGDVKIQYIQDLPAFLEEHGLSICYFDGEYTTYSYGKVQETGEVAYFHMFEMVMTETAVDHVRVYAAVILNTEFEYHYTYSQLTSTTTVGDIEVKYNKCESTYGNLYAVVAKFVYEDVEYCIDIDSDMGVELALQTYITKLIGK